MDLKKKKLQMCHFAYCCNHGMSLWVHLNSWLYFVYRHEDGSNWEPWSAMHVYWLSGWQRCANCLERSYGLSFHVLLLTFQYSCCIAVHFSCKLVYFCFASLTHEKQTEMYRTLAVAACLAFHPCTFRAIKLVWG